MINPLISNLKTDLDKKRQEIEHKEAELKAVITKITTLHAEIKTTEDKIRSEKNEITLLEQGDKSKDSEVKREILKQEALQREITVLKQRQSQSTFELTKITREAADKERREAAQNKTNSPHHL